MAQISKEELKENIYLKNSILVEGISFKPDIFKNIKGLGTDYIERVNALFAFDKEAHKEYEFPAVFYTPKGGYRVQIRWNDDSKYNLRFEDGIFNLYFENKLIIEDIQFARRPHFYTLKTSDGADMRTIAQDYGYNNIFIVYSNECCLKDKGKDCLFCNINATKSIYGEQQNIQWKTAKQVGETVKAAYDEGFDHLTVSGGFVPERREVDYYVDIAEAIQEHTGLFDFNGTACVGAPNDLSAVERLKEVGFRTIATNIEIWNDKLFDVICPGKKEFSGGRDKWIEALKYEVDVFGRFNVRSTLVSGIEPKESILEGIEFLVSNGIVALPNQWYVNVGSALEGHRTPLQDWHWEVFERTCAIYKKYGVTWDQLRNANAEPDTVNHDLLRLEYGITLTDEN